MREKVLRKKLKLILRKNIKLLNSQFFNIGKVLTEKGSREVFIKNDIKKLGEIIKQNKISKEDFSKVKKRLSRIG